ncbi:F0F1 ATP synthase subunit B [candidate division KSB1 bacterium]|nr:F0F1 ATP synthase subunit B [candidate division KSB1 bacterium]
MQIDWITLVAQIINFLILLFLLKHFLFDKIVSAMRKRQERIDNKLQDAESTREEAEQKLQEYQQMKSELEKQKNDMLKNAEQEANKRKEDLLDDARNKIDQLSEKWKSEIEKEKEEFFKTFRHKVGSEIYQTSKTVLKDLADKKIESAITDKFIDKINNLSDSERDKIQEHLNDSDALLIRTTYELEKRSDLEQVLKKQFGKDLQLDFNVTDDFIGGIELVANGYKVIWSIEEFTQHLLEKFNDYIEKNE